MHVAAGLMVLSHLAGAVDTVCLCVFSCAGASYPEFIQSMHLPAQLAEVDPIVASFCGGAVGVVSALLVVEVSCTTVLMLGCPLVFSSSRARGSGSGSETTSLLSTELLYQAGAAFSRRIVVDSLQLLVDPSTTVQVVVAADVGATNFTHMHLQSSCISPA